MPLRFPTLPTLLGLALVSACAAGVRASETRHDVGVDVTLGYDSNPLRINGAGEEVGGAFAELGLQAAVEVPLSRRIDWTIDGLATTRLHDSATARGDRDDVELSTALEIRPNPRSRRRAVLRLGGSFSMARSTFTDRTSGQVYEVDSDPVTVPATPVQIPDRFDADVASAFVEASWRAHRRVRVTLAARLDEARYPEDYAADTNLLPLDYGALTLRPGVRLQIGGKAVLGFEAVLTDLDYEAQPALDGNGQEVPGTLRKYRYSSYAATLRWVPSPRWNLRLGVVDGTRDDAYAGYYDTGSLTGFAGLDHRPSARSRIQIYASMRDLDYDSAQVPGAVNGEFRGNEVNRFLTRYDRTFGRQLGWFAVAGTQRTVSTDPVFSYDRDWLETGLRYRL